MLVNDVDPASLRTSGVMKNYSHNLEINKLDTMPQFSQPDYR